MTDYTTPLYACSFEELVGEMQKRGSFVMGVVLLDSTGEDVQYYIEDRFMEISTLQLAQGLVDAVRDDDDSINTDFDQIDPYDPNEVDDD